MKYKKNKTKKKAQIKANLKQQTPKSKLPANKKKHHRLALRFTPTAWAKLLHFRDKSDNEVGGFGITESDDLLLVTDFITVKQEVTAVSVKFEDQAVANYFEDQVDLARMPEQFARVWCHSHPGDCPEPSMTDEETFKRVFGSCQWAVMFILAQDNKTYTRISFNVGPAGQVLIPTEIDYSLDFGSSDHYAWDIEYETNIKAVSWLDTKTPANSISSEDMMDDYALPEDFINELQQMDPSERQFILDELAERPELWDQESEVMYL